MFYSFYFEKVSLFINYYQNLNCFKGSFFQKLYRKPYQFKNCFLLAYTFEKKSIYDLLKIFQYNRPSIRSITNTKSVKLFEKPQKKLSSKKIIIGKSNSSFKKRLLQISQLQIILTINKSNQQRTQISQEKLICILEINLI